MRVQVLLGIPFPPDERRGTRLGASLHHCSFSRMIFTLVSRPIAKLACTMYMQLRACTNLLRCALLSRAECSKDGTMFSSPTYTVQCS